jgi:hypothetical protein
MNKKIRKELRELKKQKSFLENKLRWAVNDLNFYEHLNAQDEKQKTINYLDISWVQYDEITERIKALKHDLRNWKLVR